MTLPSFMIGEELFLDMSAIVGPDRYRRGRTDALLVHHAGAGAAIGDDLNFNGTTEDEEEAWIRSINAYHRDVKGWSCGFGYQAVAFPSSRVYVAGTCGGARAHIAGLNNLYAGIVLPGDWSTEMPPPGGIAGARRWVAAMRRQHGWEIPVVGHREVALPREGTACPGEGGMVALALIRAVEGGADVSIESRIESLEVVLYGHTFTPEDQERVDRLLAEEPSGLVAADASTAELLDQLEARIAALEAQRHTGAHSHG